MASETNYYRQKDSKENRSPALFEIIQGNKGFIVKWAMPIMGTIMLLLFFCLQYIPYPDIISADVVLRPASPSFPQKNIYYLIGRFTDKDREKIKSGQQIQLNLHDYPKEKFGLLIGIVLSKDDASSDNETIMIKLPNGLITERKKKIPYYPGLTAQAYIITANDVLLKKWKQLLKTHS